jgi:hypothetical protein
MKNLFVSTILTALPVAAGLTVIAAAAYVNEQQILRSDANEPQVGIAHDLARARAASITSVPLIQASSSIPIESSNSAYTVIYDANGNPVNGTGVLNGMLPKIPAGIFDVARTKGEDLLTWQPQTNVREAIAVVPVANGAGGYVLAGRSLAYTEMQESQLTRRWMLGWIASMGTVLLFALLSEFLKRRA